MLNFNDLWRFLVNKREGGGKHHKWLPYQILDGKAVRNVQIDPQTTEIWLK